MQAILSPFMLNFVYKQREEKAFRREGRYFLLLKCEAGD